MTDYEEVEDQLWVLLLGASTAEKQDRQVDAEILLQQALILLESHLDRNHKGIANVTMRLAALYARQGRHLHSQYWRQRTHEILRW